MPHRGARYILFQLDLAVARINEPFDIAGGFLFIRGASAAGSNITIRFDDPTASAIPFKKGDNAELQFRTLYISNAAQAGRTLDILVTESSEEFKYELATEISTISLIDSLTTIVDPVNISDRAARLLGVIASITNPVDISDRISRDLGVVDSITDPVNISDRAARLLGLVTTDAVKLANAYDEVGKDGNIINSPSAGAQLATTGDLPAGLYAFDFVIGAASAFWFPKIQHRSAADAVLNEVIFTSVNGELITWNAVFDLAVNEDVRVVTQDAEIVDVSAWISWRRLKA